MIPGLMVAGGAMSLLGTGANMYGSYKRDKATRKAQKAYEQAVAQRVEQQRAGLEQESGILHGLAGERQTGIGQYLDNYSAAQRPGTDGGFAQRQTSALSDIGKMTQGGDNAYAYSGAPQAQAQTMQNTQTTGDNRRMAEAMLADHQLGQIDEREQRAGHRMSLADLLRSYRGGDIQKQLSLKKALQELDWQKQTTALQANLDEAGRKGQWMNVLGGLGTQIGGMGMMAGMMGSGAEGAALPEGAELRYSGTSPIGHELAHA